MSKKEENNKPNPEKTPFSVPGNYFNSFSKKMMLKIELAEELKDFEILSSIDKKLPFITPEDYFESKAELNEFPELQFIKDRSVFITPANYFTTSAISIKSKIELEDEKAMYPALFAIEKQTPFVLPANYFGQLSSSLYNDLSSSSQNQQVFGKVLHLVFNRKTAYAIAAMLVLSLGLYLYNSSTEAASENCNTLACLDRSDVFKTNQLSTYDEDALLEIVNTDELSKNLNSKLKDEDKKAKSENIENYALDNMDVNDIADEI